MKCIVPYSFFAVLEEKESDDDHGKHFEILRNSELLIE